MRIPKYISPSSLDLFERDPEKYYLRYLCDNPVKDPIISKPMSIGSAFDAFVKAALAEKVDHDLDFEETFKSQVPEEHQEWCRIHGKYLFDVYKESGAFADIVKELKASVVKPSFEFKAGTTVEGIPIFGYPDMFYMNPGMRKVSLDWKVNGYCSKSGAKSKPHYLMHYPTRLSHKKCMVADADGTTINIGCSGLEATDKQWATQQCMYNWMLGANVGENFIVTLEQICCKPSGTEFPDVDIYRYRTIIGKQYQQSLLDRLRRLWSAIENEWIFDKLSKEESLKKQQRIENLSKMKTSDDPTDRLMSECL